MFRAGKAPAFVGVCMIVALLAACVPAPPPPPPPEIHDVLVVGDSLSYSYGCVLGDDQGSGDPCPAQPGFTTKNGQLGGCNIGGGWLLNYAGTAHSSYACSDWPSSWAQLADQHQPRVVVISTSGWEIVDRWGSFPGGCDPADARNCPVEPDLQWGEGNTSTLQNYAANLAGAINLFRSRGAHVLVANAPYVAPPQPELALGIPVWYERYESTQGDWVPPSNAPGYTYRSSKPKIEELNATVAAVVNALGSGVTMFDLYSHLSPGGEYSDFICPPPNDGVPPGGGCPGGQAAILARHADGSHLSIPGGFDTLAFYLRPCVRGLLGIESGGENACS